MNELNKKNYLLSIVIPTRNRQEYALQAIAQILSATDSNTQIVVQDNSDNDSLSVLINAKNNPRIKYSHTSEVLSFVDNFEIAVSLADGKYITLIGDDDGVLSNINKIVDYANEHELDSVTSKILTTYYWPNSGAINYKCTDKEGYIRIHDFNGSIKSVDNIDVLIKVLKNGCQFYYNSGLAKLYHGIVKKDLLDKIKEKEGRLFYGLSPDIYSSFLISLYAKKSIAVDFPYTIDGNCPKSGAGAQAQGKHTGSLKDAPHFKGHKNYQWNELVPYVYSIQTIWADSALAALKNANRKDLIKFFNKEKLTAYTMFNNKTIMWETLKSYIDISKESHLFSLIRLLFASVNGPLTNILGRVINRIKGKGQVGYIINFVPNIQIASEQIEKYLVNKENDKYERI